MRLMFFATVIGCDFEKHLQAMKQLYSILIFVLVASIELIAQTDLPFNMNGAFIPDSKGFNVIKSTRTYDSTDYLAEKYNYFDTNGLNFKTVSFYKGEKQGFVLLTCDENNRIKELKLQQTYFKPDNTFSKEHYLEERYQRLFSNS